ncbi:MAG: hypothetical protein RL358_1575 [Pseudomonadota bacterium]|jgi:hypothetical protein
MATNIEKLEKKRARLEAEILQAKQTEKRKARVLQLIVTTLEKHPRVLETSDEILCEKLDFVFDNLSKNLPSVKK